MIRRDEGLLPGPHDPLSIRLAPKAEGLGLVRGGMARFFAGRGRVKIARGEIADNRLLHGPEHGPEHGALIPETDFDLGWVHVYVHFFRRQIHEQDDLRVFLGKEAPLVGFADGAQDDLVVDGPAVDVEQHPVAARLGLSGRGDQPVDADVIGGAVERQQGFRNGIGPDDREALLQGLSGGEPQDFPRPGKEDEARVRMRERQTGEEFLRTLLFGRGRFQKFEAGGDGGEEVADFDDRSLVQAARPLLGEHAVFHLDEGRVGLGVFRGAESRLHAETGHGRDARQGFAAEPEGADVPEIVHAGYFAGGVARDGQLQLGGGDARAVVPDPDEALPAVFQRDLDQRCSGVEAVFHKFFDYACGAFHDFTGCDLIAQFG